MKGTMERMAKGTHRPLGKKAGEKSGLESGLAGVEKFTAGQGVEIVEKTQRPKPRAVESIAAG